MSYMKKRAPGCLGYLFGDYTTQLKRIIKEKHYNDPYYY